MNDNDADSGTTRRWWLNPALAQLAFGTSTRGATGQPSSAASMMDRALLHTEMASLDLDDPAQREFGDYELLELVGQGGMGVVFRARQRGLDREVAIKLLSAGQWASQEFVEGFRREAQNAALLQHPNIVVVHEMGEHAGLIYYAMQLVRGRSLSQQIDHDGIMPSREAAALLRTVAEAVDYAHRLGVLHLDLKPGNILLDENGTPLVADFGLARRLEQALDNERISGTPSYMAPEQAQVQGPALSPATDVWALGAVLYELLTGQPPFDGGDPQETLRMLLKGEVRKPSRLAVVPADLEAICLKCLAKDPAQRYPGARALADDLGRFLEGRAVSVRPLNALQRTARWARREPRLATTAALAIIALLIGVITTSLQWRRAETNATASIARLWESRREAALRLGQDGKGYEALPRLLQNIEEQEHAGKHDLANLERRRIGMMLGQGAVLIDAIAIADANPLAVELSDDGSLLAIALSDQSVRWFDTATLTERGRVSLQGRISSNGQPRAPVLLRFVDNHRLRVTLEWYSNYVSPTDGDTWLVDLDHKAVVEPPAGFVDASYSADGRHALLRTRSKQVELWQVSPWRRRTPVTYTDKDGRSDFVPWQIGPDGRFAIVLSIGMDELQVHRFDQPGKPRAIWFPGAAGISAWMLSRDGATLALGDFEGRIFLLDIASGAVRVLSSSLGREITWVAFSEDDAWLAAVSWDGAAYAFDVDSGDTLVSGQMQHDFTLQRVGVSRERRLLIAAGEGQTALWRLPQPGPRALPAQRIGAGPAPHGLAGRYPISWSLKSGLLASAGIDGQVRLWRLPLSPMVPARAARQVPEKTWFDGERLVDVVWNRLRIVTPAGVPLTPWRSLAQPPGFAELVDQGRSLVTIVGPQLHVYDSRNLQLRFPPVALPDSPQRLLTSDDGSRVLLDFGAPGKAGFEDRLRMYDLRTGRRLPGTVALAGPLRMLAFSQDGTRLIAVGPEDASTTVLATAGLRPIGEYPHDPYQPVLWADFRHDGRDVLLVTRASDPRLGNDALLVWDPVADAVRTQQETENAQPIGVMAMRNGAFLAGVAQDLLQEHGGGLRPVERLAKSEVTAVLAASPDQRLIAHAFMHEVQLFDAATGAAIGVPLQGDSNAMDVIMQLAFSPDSRQLLARTLHNHWLVWEIPVETRPAPRMAADFAHLSARNEDQQRIRVLGAAERTLLRTRDPGRWPTFAPRPAPVAVAAGAAAALGRGVGYRDELPIPARSPGTSSLMLDLTPVYNRSPDSVHNTIYRVFPSMRAWPVGVQRIAGVDYDLRGMADTGRADELNTKGFNKVTCVATPEVPVAAVHALVSTVVREPVPGESTVAVVVLHYRNGSSAVLPIRTGREAPGYAGNDQAVPWAFATKLAVTVMGLRTPVLVAPRLPNPHPERPIRCIGVASHADGEPLVVFGLTLEPVSPDPGIVRSVTSADVPRTNQQQDSNQRPRAPTPTRRSP